MTSRLVLLRHGKSDWSAGLPDRDRPLAPRGRRQAAEAGRWLAAHERVDLAVVSPANRARTTWEVASAALPEPPEVRLDDRVYAATGSALLEVVRRLDVPTALLVGHNPGLEDLLELLTGDYAELPTASIAVVDLEAGALLAHGRPPR